MKIISVVTLFFSLSAYAGQTFEIQRETIPVDAQIQVSDIQYNPSISGSGLSDSVEQKAFPPKTVMIPGLLSDVGSKAKKNLDPQATQCTSRGRLARGACLTSMNPKIATAASGITALLAAMDMTKGQKDSCEKFGSAMDIAKTAVTAYTAACGAARMACTSSCQTLLHSIATTEGTLNADKAAASASCSSSGTRCEQPALIEKDLQALATVRNELTTGEMYNEGLIVQCDKYKLKIAAGVAGIYSIVQSAKGGKKCEEQLAANDGSSSGLDCSKPENAQVVECMCRANPTLAGCVGGGSGNNNNDPYQQISGNPLPRSEGDASGDGNIDLSSAPAADSTSPFAGGSDSLGGGLGGAAGGGGGGGFPMSGTGKAADGGGVAGKPLNKNILSGYEGGGGGGGSGGYSDNAYADQFKQFMPGAEKDPARNPSSFAGGQVTGNGGKSNWEKVRERYQANRPSLIVGGP